MVRTRNMSAIPDLNVSGDAKVLLDYMKVEFNKFTQELTNLRSDFYDLLASKLKEVDDLKVQVVSLEKHVKKLEDEVDSANAYERRDVVIFSGKGLPACTQGENCSAVVQKLVKDNLSLELDMSDISTAHRLGIKSPQQSDDKRSMIVKFCRRDKKREILVASKTQANPNIYANESLTPTRKAIHTALRKMKREHPTLVKGCSTIDGRVYAYTAPVSSRPDARDLRHHIANMDTLREFCRTYVKLPLDSFLQNWQT